MKEIIYILFWWSIAVCVGLAGFAFLYPIYLIIKL